MGEPISRWLALLVTAASLPFACAAVAAGLITQSSVALGIGLAWVGVLALLTVIVQVGVTVVNYKIARATALPRAWAASRKSR